MTAKDYVAVAACIAAERRNAGATPAVHHYVCGVLDNVAFGLADVYARDNPRFSREMFLAACGTEELDALHHRDHAPG